MISTGSSQTNINTAIDLGKMLSKLGKEIGRNRQIRFAEWAAGYPMNRLPEMEFQQLKSDVKRLAALAVNGGYGLWLHD